MVSWDDLMKLYRVLLKGMHGNVVSTHYGHPYVIADTPTEALEKVQDYLTKRDIGFVHEREMETIELLAEEGDYPDCNIQLFL
jgi:hypothetical protein